MLPETLVNELSSANKKGSGKCYMMYITPTKRIREQTISAHLLLFFYYLKGFEFGLELMLEVLG